MKEIARATFEIQSWDEKQWDEIPGASRMTRASVSKSYKGEMEGEGKLEYLMAYSHDGSASFVGIERFAGRVGDKQGNFVFQHVGMFRNGVAESTWSVVPDSGGGDLQGLRGEVNVALGHAKPYPIEFSYELGS